MRSDPIADLLTRIRNASNAEHEKVDIPSSKLKVRIAELLKDEGFIKNFRVLDDSKQNTLRVYLKYGAGNVAKIENVEKELLAAIDELGKKAPSAAEMKKARAKIEHAFMFGLQTNLSRGLELAGFEGERGDASLLVGEVDKYLAVTPEQVKAAVAKYLVKEKVAHVRVLPPPEKEEATPQKKEPPKKEPEKKEPTTKEKAQ